MFVVAGIFYFVWNMPEPEPRVYPNPDGWVTDISGVLEDQAEEQVERTIQGFKDANGHEIAVLLVPTLDGETVEEYSMNVAEQWEVGTEGLDDGILLLIATEDRKVRIEVGYGLEGGLTDATSGDILDDVIVPYLKENDWNGAVLMGVVAINETILAK